MARSDPTDDARYRDAECPGQQWIDLSSRYDRPPVESRNDTYLRGAEDLKPDREHEDDKRAVDAKDLVYDQSRADWPTLF